MKKVEQKYQGAAMTTVDKSALKKSNLFETSQVKYFIRCMLAGMFLTLGTSIAVMVAEKAEHMLPGSGKFFYSFMFAWSLVMINYMNTELGTSNMMYMTAAIYRKVLAPKRALAILFACILFNLIGGAVASFIMSFTNIFQDLPAEHFLFHAVEGKLLKTPIQMVAEGIFANVIVNTTVFVSAHMKDDAGKIFSTIFIIFIFAFLGFEHVIANFTSFSLAFFAYGGALPGMTVGSVLTNWFFTMIGNYIGGGLIIGLLYSWMNKDSEVYVD